MANEKPTQKSSQTKSESWEEEATRILSEPLFDFSKWLDFFFLIILPILGLACLVWAYFRGEFQ